MDTGDIDRPLDRTQALRARPVRVPVVRREEQPDGRLCLTVRTRAPRWFRWLGAREGELERTYRLDGLGREVYEACDGMLEVEAIIGRFAAAHRISRAEAEISVTCFLRTLTAKGLIVMQVEPDSN